MLGVATGARLNAGVELDRTLDHIAATGADFIRWGARPGPGGVYDYKKLDPIWDGIAKRGMATLFQVSGWDNNMNAHAAEFARNAGDCARRYSHFDPIAWEMGNETEHVIWSAIGDGLPGPTPQAYTPLLKQAYEAVKATGSTAPVIIGGLGGMHADWQRGKNCVDYLAELYPLVTGYFDGIGFHPYSDPGTWADALAGGVRGAGLLKAAHQVARGHGDLNMPFFITELGWPSHAAHDARHGTAQRISEADQAARLLEAVTDMNRHPWIHAIAWFDHSDIGQDLNNRGDWMGLYRQDWSAKPIVDTFRRLAA